MAGSRICKSINTATYDLEALCKNIRQKIKELESMSKYDDNVEDKISEIKFIIKNIQRMSESMEETANCRPDNF